MSNCTSKFKKSNYSIPNQEKQLLPILILIFYLAFNTTRTLYAYPRQIMGGAITMHQVEEGVRSLPRNFGMALEFPPPSPMSTDAIPPKSQMITHHHCRRDPPESTNTIPLNPSTLSHRHRQRYSTATANDIPSNPPTLSNHHPTATVDTNPLNPSTLSQHHCRCYPQTLSSQIYQRYPPEAANKKHSPEVANAIPPPSPTLSP